MTKPGAGTWRARVRVMLKPVINDPQGKAMENGWVSLGFGSVQEVRAGKYLEILVAAETASEAQRQTDEMCRKLLANPVIEDYTFEVEAAATASAPQP